MDMIRRRRFLLTTGALPLLASLHPSAVAQGTAGAATRFPERPIRMLCGFGVGGGTDVVGRVIAQRMQQAWGQPVTMENITGAGGVIATDRLAKSAPDGYTIAIVALGHAFSAAYVKKLPYDTLKDIDGVSLVADVPNVLVVSQTSGVKSLRDLIDVLRTKGDRANFASAGETSASYINAQLFNVANKVKPTHIPFKTMPDALTQLMVGEVDYAFSSIPAATGLIRGGRLTALAVSTQKRAPSLPDVQSMSEAGMPDFDFSTWYGLIAPAGTPAAIKQKIAQEVTRILGDKDVEAALIAQGASARSGSPAQFDALIRDEVQRMTDLIKTVGIAQQ